MITKKSAINALDSILREAFFENNGEPKTHCSAVSLEDYGDDLVVTVKTGEKIVYSVKVLSAPLPR